MLATNCDHSAINVFAAADSGDRPLALPNPASHSPGSSDNPVAKLTGLPPLGVTRICRYCRAVSLRRCNTKRMV